MLYLKQTIKRFLIIIPALIIFFINTGYSQEDSVEVKIEPSPYADTLVTEFWPNVIRSAIIPGYGQIMQERPGKAVVFYVISGSLVYNGAFNYYRYTKSKNNKYLERSRIYAYSYGAIYLINVFDAVCTQLDGKNIVWKSDMFSDYPMKSPWGATARSAMLPGWGQFYNDQYIKSIIVFGIVADFVRKAIVFNEKYKDTGNKAFLERRSVNTWYAGLAYSLNMVDAFVDAYLYKFDETMDMSMAITPVEDTIGFSLTLSF